MRQPQKKKKNLEGIAQTSRLLTQPTYDIYDIEKSSFSDSIRR